MPKKSVNINGAPTKAIIDNIYPLIDKSFKINMTKWKLCVSRFMQKRSNLLFDNMPCDRIYYKAEDGQDLLDSLKIDKKIVLNFLAGTYYWEIDPFKPSSAKDVVTIVALCIVRYFIMKNDRKNTELSCMYLSFSGKFYPSIHYGSFPTVAPNKYRYIIRYIIHILIKI